jgi:ABC-type branched-subunit amino acid transport system substrate-binding protein
VTLKSLDYKSEPATAVRFAEALAKDGFTCLTGPVGSGHAGRVGAQVSTPKRVLQITPSASAGQITAIKDRGYLNRVVPPDKLQVQALIEHMSRELHRVKGKKVNIGAIDVTYGKNLTKAFEEQWRKKGGIIGQKATYRADATSVAPQGDQLGQGKPDAWVFFDFTDTYVRVAQELVKDKKSGWKPSKTFATDSLANPRLPGIGPNVSDGLSGVAISAPENGKAAEAFDAAFKRKGGVNRQTFDAQEFDAVVLCYLAAVAAGSTSGPDMKDELPAITSPPGHKYTWLQLDQAVRALENGEDIDYEGVSGPIDMNAEGDATAGVYDVYRYKKGKMEISRDQIAIPLRAGGV